MVAIPRPAPLPFPGFRRPRLSGWGMAAAILVGAAFTMPVIQASTTTKAGFEAERLRAERERVEAEIGALEGEIAALTSQSRVEQRARALGFIPAEGPLHITIDVPGPDWPRVPTEYFAVQP